MNIKVIFLAFATFATGTAENIIVGILPDVASGLGVSIALAGQLTAVFSISFALAAPAALWLTARAERKTVFLAALVLFIASNLLAAASPGYACLFAARVGMAAASATICLVGTTLATAMAGEEMRGRAIGIIFMGISGSLVLGVPMGMAIDAWFGWRSVFVALALLAAIVLVISMAAVPVSGRSGQGSPGYLRHLRVRALVGAQLVSILMIGGHFVVFAYLAPYAADAAGIPKPWIIPAFIAFGVAGVSGGYLGGWLSDGMSPRFAILFVPFAYLSALATIPLAAGLPWLAFMLMMIWCCISWMISPVVQSFLMATSPETAQAGVSLNFSAMHLGVGLGTAVGGLTMKNASLLALPLSGAILASLAVVSSVVAVRSAKAARFAFP
ncbi:MFS transporter [Phyllobacterium myrsinacearum]|uniref:MFS transporter n=1 Tax=Phyllobacterium myrsinacearum TaxID=28101 RepID=A0A2S9JY59_9HYPH|nr:MFS transporter [Phyllobacterium myrsinacearum]PRD58281.1 MFS transporter [Phyllobacterium myrsinacearum]PWV96497.1 DHA1 family purine base/nucleoside efflux pump-like MFS transporter [Phyllobacterium myrsinacearum]RZV09513.1 DHA1 family purine base/nucleoside efflux pump-like MFS transporter [Phyllobacterium myrsinacearum]